MWLRKGKQLHTGNLQGFGFHKCMRGMDMATIIRCLLMFTCIIMYMLRDMPRIMIYGVYVNIKSTSEYG